jgi:DNA modification methylase
MATEAGGLVLDPFLGSGTTALAALAEGRRCVGVERDAGYCAIARRRLQEAESNAPLFDVAAKPE